MSVYVRICPKCQTVTMRGECPKCEATTISYNVKSTDENPSTLNISNQLKEQKQKHYIDKDNLNTLGTPSHIAEIMNSSIGTRLAYAESQCKVYIKQLQQVIAERDELRARVEAMEEQRLLGTNKIRELIEENKQLRTVAEDTQVRLNLAEMEQHSMLAEARRLREFKITEVSTLSDVNNNRENENENEQKALMAANRRLEARCRVLENQVRRLREKLISYGCSTSIDTSDDQLTL